ncbi:MAG: copper homeostasis protein CutC, partial [Bacteroidales bacterium]|nr:copper homeostasis protein CutC [Bacteroidales bacterium]
GDFYYSEEEIAQIISDIHFCKAAGVEGVVIGFLHKDGSVNIDYCRRSIAAAQGMQVTFHRAFDRCADWPKALEQIIECGFNRILTSGQQPTAIQGVETLKQIQYRANGRIAILAGSGINAQNAVQILRGTGVTEVHGSCKISGYESDEAEIRNTLQNIEIGAE